MIRKLFFLSLLILLSLKGYSQKRENIWELGYHGKILGGAGINFINGTPDTFTSVYRPMTFFLTDNSICDSNGNLLFYTNGQYIANRKNDSLQNCKNFNPGIENEEYANQGQPYIESFVILPDPGNSNRYYVIGTNGEEVYSRGFYQDKPLDIKYSIVDMTKDSGYGGIDSSHKAITIFKDSLARGFITACKNGNGRDWWIIIHQWYYNRFYKLLLTSNGISKIDSQNIGSIIPNDVIGQACFSPDGSHYALIRNSGDLDIFNFDRCSGLFSDSINIKVPIDAPYEYIYGPFGCAFSSSGRFLYVDDESHLYQYDLQSGNINTSKILIAHYHHDPIIDPDSIDLFFPMQLRPDNKIYMNTLGGSQYFHVINSPDSAGLNSNFKQYQLVISDFNLAIPTFPNYQLGPELGSDCDTLTSIQNTKVNRLKLSAYPNPVHTSFFLSYHLPQNTSGEVEVFNLLGQRIYSATLSPWSSIHEIDAGKWANGIYEVKISSPNQYATLKIVKE
jgi:hypothetical protein